MLKAANWSSAWQLRFLIAICLLAASCGSQDTPRPPDDKGASDFLVPQEQEAYNKLREQVQKQGGTLIYWPENGHIVELDWTEPTVSDLVHLKSLKHLEKLHLRHAGDLNTNSLSYLTELRNLTALHVQGAPIDNVAAALSSLVNLKLLELYSTKVTAAGAEALRAKLPGLKIDRLNPNFEAEEFVKQQVKKGKEADLEKRFADSADRVLRAEFVRRLLLGSLKDVEIQHRGIRIRNAVFVEPIDLVNVEIRHEVWMRNCDFRDDADFSRSHFYHSLMVDKSSFRGAKFGMAKVDGALLATGADFTWRLAKANFNNVKVGENARFDQATFDTYADFGGAEIGDQFIAFGAKFRDTKKGASFNGMRARASFLFLTEFDGPANFVSMQVDRLEVRGARFTNSQEEVQFDEMIVKKYASFATSTDQDLAYVENAKKRNVVFMGPVSMRDARFRRLGLENVEWPKDPHKSVRLENMRYDQIYVGEEGDSKIERQHLLYLASRANFHLSVYRNLEKWALREGKKSLANRFYIAGQNRESRIILQQSWLSFPRFAGRWMLFFLVGHGRHPEWAFVWSFVVLLLGWWVYRDKAGMQPRSAEYASSQYSAIWYSLDLFIPGIDLWAVSAWRPKDCRRFANIYMRLHKLAGWVLIPIGIAALMGIIK